MGTNGQNPALEPVHKCREDREGGDSGIIVHAMGKEEKHMFASATVRGSERGVGAGRGMC